jgi:hypothetical protein
LRKATNRSRLYRASVLCAACRYGRRGAASDTYTLSSLPLCLCLSHCLDTTVVGQICGWDGDSTPLLMRRDRSRTHTHIHTYTHTYERHQASTGGRARTNSWRVLHPAACACACVYIWYAWEGKRREAERQAKEGACPGRSALVRHDLQINVLEPSACLPLRRRLQITRRITCSDATAGVV